MKTSTLAPDAAGVARCAEILRGGGLVGLPTETVYGLAADATNAVAVARIYAAKGRPAFNPLIAHVPDLAAALRQGRFDPAALALAEAFWPGPLTLVVPVADTVSVCELARAGLSTLALRIPAHRLALEVIRAAACPVAAPSANRSGRISPTEAGHVLDELAGRVDAVLDGGPTGIGVESTIISCLADGPRLLRPGGLPRGAIEAVLGRALPDRTSTGQAHGAACPSAPVSGPLSPALLAPGLLASHYAPAAALRLAAAGAGADEGFLAFGPVPEAARRAAHILNLSPSGDLTEAAANLFGHLRALDARGIGMIAVAPVPDEGLGEAINDRLRRAAHPRR